MRQVKVERNLIEGEREAAFFVCLEAYAMDDCFEDCLEIIADWNLFGDFGDYVHATLGHGMDSDYLIHNLEKVIEKRILSEGAISPCYCSDCF